MLEVSLHSDVRYQRYQDLLKEAETTRLAQQATAHHNTLTKRFLAYVGDILITSGYRLKQRYEPEPSHANMPVFQVGAKRGIVI